MYSHDSSSTHLHICCTRDGILPEETDEDSEHLDDQAAEENAFSEELKKIWALEMTALDHNEKLNKK